MIGGRTLLFLPVGRGFLEKVIGTANLLKEDAMKRDPTLF